MTRIQLHREVASVCAGDGMLLVLTALDIDISWIQYIASNNCEVDFLLLLDLGKKEE